MYSEDGGPCVCSAMVYAPFTHKSPEAHLSDGFVERLIPDTARLFHAIKTFHETHDPIFFPWRLEARRLFYEDRLGVRQDTMQEGRFYVDVLDIPVEYSSNVEQGTERFETCGGCCCLFVIHKISLGKPFCYVAYFIARDVASIVTLSFAYEFAF
jgi:hypothetical protein